jgi:CRISPR/Cas system CSM-associated protein Csm4 (group 5 of RAMP superfamily)
MFEKEQTKRKKKWKKTTFFPEKKLANIMKIKSAATRHFGNWEKQVVQLDVSFGEWGMKSAC